MTTYKAIHGKLIQHVASDLDSAEGEGQVWYNTTSTDYKTIVRVAGSWSSGGALNAGRYRMGSAGTRDAALAFGGNKDPGQANETESYNGSSWTELANLNTARSENGGCGPQTAALCIAGSTSGDAGDPVVVVEQWNGSSWTEIADLNVAKAQIGSGGTTTAAFAAAGTTEGASVVATNEIWNGTAWTEAADANTARQLVYGLGTTTAGMIFGGYVAPSPQSIVETWNGTSWTEVGDLNTASYGRGGSGTQTAALAFGGSAPTANTELWDGTSWTEVANLSDDRYTTGGTPAGNVSAALCYGGQGGASGGVTEEWDQTSTLGAGAWASGGNLNVARSSAFGQGTGTQTAAKVSGGLVTTIIDNSEDYDGSSWTEVGDLSTGRYTSGELGTQAAAIFIAGNPAQGEPHRSKLTETFDGTSWTEVGDLQGGQDKALFGSAGTQTAAFVWAGHQFPGLSTTAEQWDGSSWTSSTNVSTNREQGGSSGFGGTNTAAFYVGGGPPESALHEQWNGSAWAEAADLNTARRANFAMATNNDFAVTGGGEGTGTTDGYALVEQYDGTSWTEVANTNVEAYNTASSPSGTAGLMIGQADSPHATTEEWTVAQNIKTITD